MVGGDLAWAISGGSESGISSKSVPGKKPNSVGHISQYGSFVLSFSSRT